MGSLVSSRREQRVVESFEIDMTGRLKLRDFAVESRPGHDLCRMRRAGDEQELCRAHIEWRESARQSALET